MDAHRKGFWLGFLAVVLFALNFPAMKIAVQELDAITVGLGRGLLAAVPSAVLLVMTRQRLPRREHFLPLLLTSAGAVIGFPLFLAIALKDAPASHAAIVAGLMPLATAVLGSWRERERQSPLFWVAAVAGSSVVVLYAFLTGDGTLPIHDGALFLAILSAAVGYTEGARLGRSLGSWQVICWALLVAAPFMIYPVVQSVQEHGVNASFTAWVGFVYAGLVSMFLGYFIWYRGLMLGGIARVSQVQLLQPFLALGFCALLLGEVLTLPTVGCALLVCGCVALTRKLKPSAVRAVRVVEEV
jgi:drug/metabolite transporter (DMT)-like permease